MSNLQLIERINRPNACTYLPPGVGLPDQEALASPDQVIDHVRGVHCFAWWPEQERLPVNALQSLWRDISEVLGARGSKMMLEFVEGDGPGQRHPGHTVAPDTYQRAKSRPPMKP